MRDERARRKPGFHPGIDVRLADGQVWSLPVPIEQLDQDAHGRARTKLAWNDPTYASIIGAVTDAEDPGELFRAELALAIHLLDWNYILDPDDFEELLDDRGDFRQRQELRSTLHTLALAHTRTVNPANGDDPQKDNSLRQDDGRPPISQFVSRILGRLGTRGSRGSADLPT
jgi:hypothetical protein